MTTKLNTELWIYPVGDSSKSGSYTKVEGYDLCDEGSDKVLSREQFIQDANDLINNCEFNCDFALVERILDQDGECVDQNVLEIYSKIDRQVDLAVELTINAWKNEFAEIGVPNAFEDCYSYD